ncbi:hypothetical protein VCR14J2_430150 [Vibrio coralliirubri]|nr:hypothetical protein VCR14J2_430150 [Vibrio coralliirubri]
MSEASQYYEHLPMKVSELRAKYAKDSFLLLSLISLAIR